MASTVLGECVRSFPVFTQCDVDNETSLLSGRIRFHVVQLHYYMRNNRVVKNGQFMDYVVHLISLVLPGVDSYIVSYMVQYCHYRSRCFIAIRSRTAHRSDNYRVIGFSPAVS